MQTKILEVPEALEKIKELRRNVPYRAMYSSWLQGIVKEPALMLIPVDDHLVHRGDGVFEAMKFLNPEHVYLMDEHLQRLQISAQRLGIVLPYSKTEVAKYIQETIMASGLNRGLVRVFLSRGPGGFSTNPYESQGAQLYIVVTELQNISEEKYKKGVKLGLSQWEAKSSWYAQIKSCNYLHNVMMKKEAVDRGLDFTVSLDSEGFVTEGSTENVMIVDEEGFLTHPSLQRILKGTTMMRAFYLADFLIKKGQLVLNGTRERELRHEDLKKAQEIMMVGTTLDVLPVSEYEGAVWKEFPIAQRLRTEILQDQAR